MEHEETSVIFEITTVNISCKNECRNLQYSKGDTSRRILNKVATEKRSQFIYGSDRECPVILVIFNYDEWTALGVESGDDVVRYIGDRDVPRELPAIIYMERYVRAGVSMYKNSCTSINLNREAMFRVDDGFVESLMEPETVWSQCEKA
jgi:hypothetical protein